MSKDEQTIEAEIQAKGLNAPRLRPQDIDAAIVSETFTVLPSGRVTVCELTLRNGFTVRGESAVISLENFSAEIGQKVARDSARNKVWELEGYLMKERIHSGLNEATRAQPIELVNTWNADKNRRFRAADAEPDPMGRRLIEHGAVCVFNCSRMLEEVLKLGDFRETPPPGNITQKATAKGPA